MSEPTKEWLSQKIAAMESNRDNIPFGLDEDDSNTLAALRIALASLEAEAVAWGHRLINKRNGVVNPWIYGSAEASPSEGDIFNIEVMPLYAAPPAPVSVPDEHYQNLSELYHAQEKRLFKLAQRIKGPSFDKYAYSPSQAIDVLESAIFGERADEDCCAAMLQGAEPVTTAYKLPSREHFESLCCQFWNWRELDAINDGEEEPRLWWDGNDYANRVTKALWRMYQAVSQPQSAQQNIPTLKDAVIAVRNSGIAIDAEKIQADRDALNSPAIPDGLRLALSNAGIAAPESDEMLAATCEKHIQALVTWVKDRKPFQPAAPQQE